MLALTSYMQRRVHRHILAHVHTSHMHTHACKYTFSHLHIFTYAYRRKWTSMHIVSAACCCFSSWQLTSTLKERKKKSRKKEKKQSLKLKNILYKGIRKKIKKGNNGKKRNRIKERERVQKNKWKYIWTIVSKRDTIYRWASVNRVCHRFWEKRSL